MTKLEQLRNGECALHHTGTVEELNRVLKYVFPEDGVSDGTYKFYCRHTERTWRMRERAHLPSYHTSDFLAEMNEGEKVRQEQTKDQKINQGSQDAYPDSKYMTKENYTSIPGPGEVHKFQWGEEIEVDGFDRIKKGIYCCRRPGVKGHIVIVDGIVRAIGGHAFRKPIKFTEVSTSELLDFWAKEKGIERSTLKIKE